MPKVSEKRVMMRLKAEEEALLANPLTPEDYDLLSEQQRRFVEAYVGEAEFDHVKAAEMAGYSNPRVQGCQQLTRLNIATAIAMRTKEQVISSDTTLALLSRQALGSMGDFVTVQQDGKTEFDFAKAESLGKMHLIKKMAKTRTGWTVELYSAQDALSLLGKYYALFTENMNLNVNDLDNNITRELEELACKV